MDSPVSPVLLNKKETSAKQVHLSSHLACTLSLQKPPFLSSSENCEFYTFPSETYSTEFSSKKEFNLQLWNNPPVANITPSIHRYNLRQLLVHFKEKINLSFYTPLSQCDLFQHRKSGPCWQNVLKYDRKSLQCLAVVPCRSY